MPTPLGAMRNTVGIREVRADGTVLPGAMSLDVAGGGVTIEHVEASGGQPAKYLLTVPETDLSPLEAVAPTAGEKAALAGTSGAPSGSNKYVTNADSRMTNARTPTSHASSHVGGGSDAIAVATINPGGISGLLSAAWATLLNAATDAATATTLILRDAAGRAKVADPSVDSDIDTKGARNAAITSAIATSCYFPIVFGVATPNTAGNYVPMDGNAAGASPSTGFYGLPIPANMTVEAISSTLRTAGTTASSGAYVITLYTGTSTASMSSTGTTHQHSITATRSGDTAVSQAYAAGSILAIKLSGTGSITGQGTVLTIVLWCKRG